MNPIMRIATVAAVLAVAIGAASFALSPASNVGPSASQPPSSAPPAPTATPKLLTQVDLSGRIYFGRFDLDIKGMTVWVANADGSDAHRLVDGSRLLSCVVPRTGEVVVTTLSKDGRVVPALVEADGSNLHALDVPIDRLNLGVAACSPDGKEIAAEGWFEGDEGGTGIYILDLTNGLIRRLTRAGAQAHDIPGCYARDGIAFLRYSGDGPGTLHVAARDGSSDYWIGETYGSGPACSPSGNELVLAAESRLFVVNWGEGTRREVTSTATEFQSDKYGPTFSPDGTLLMFSLKSPGPYHDLYAMRLDGSGLTRITTSPGVDNESPRWVASP
jgi:hypothetical protein